MKLPLLSKVFCLVALLSVAPAQSRANLVANHSFETGDFTSWTVNDPSLFSGVDGTAFFAEDGSNYAYLGAYPDIGSLSQSLSTVGGSFYQLSFWLANDYTPGLDDSNSFEVFWNGVSILTLTDAPVFDYTQYTFSGLLATGPSTTLEFRYRHGNDFFRLDNVSVPESFSTIWLALPVLLLFGLRRFSRAGARASAARI